MIDTKQNNNNNKRKEWALFQEAFFNKGYHFTQQLILIILHITVSRRRRLWTLGVCTKNVILRKDGDLGNNPKEFFFSFLN